MFWTKNVVGSEQHYLLSCMLITSGKNKWLPDITNTTYHQRKLKLIVPFNM